MSYYLLDTNLLIGNSRSDLETLSFMRNLVISPYVFFELFKVLRNTKNQPQNFQHQRDQILKCQIPRVLNEPFTNLKLDLGITSIASEAPLDSPELLRAIMKRLESTESLEEFYSKPMKTNDGKLREVENSARRVIENFEEEKEEYRNFIDDVIDTYRENDQDIDFLAQIKDVSEYLWSDETEVKLTETDRINIFDSIYCGMYYLYWKAQKYFEQIEQHDHDLIELIDDKDAIDFKIISHINLTDDIILITGENDILDPLREGLIRVADETEVGFEVQAEVSTEIA